MGFADGKGEVLMNSEKAELYNNWRLFLFRNRNSSRFFDLLRVAKTVLGRSSFMGVSAELAFFNEYAQMLLLTPSLDSSEHSDFTGIIGGVPCRIDVTSSKNGLDSKLNDGTVADMASRKDWVYYIVLLENNKFEFYEVNRCGGSLRRVDDIYEFQMDNHYKDVVECVLNGTKADEFNSRIHDLRISTYRKVMAAAQCRNADFVLRAFDMNQAEIVDGRGSSELKYFSDLSNWLKELEEDSRRRMECQIRFFLNYKSPLHLTAALNLNPGYDFSGFQDGRPVRYLISMDTSHIAPEHYLSSIKEGWKYWIVSLDRRQNIFRFFDSQDVGGLGVM